MRAKEMQRSFWQRFNERVCEDDDYELGFYECKDLYEYNRDHSEDLHMEF